MHVCMLAKLYLAAMHVILVIPLPYSVTMYISGFLYILEINQLLHHVKEKIPEVVLPVESVVKLELLGKGNLWLLCNYDYVTLTLYWWLP